MDLLHLVKLSEKKDDYASDLSFGQQKLLSLAQVLMLDAELILLDEPAAGINPTLQNELMALIHQLNEGREDIYHRRARYECHHGPLSKGDRPQLWSEDR